MPQPNTGGAQDRVTAGQGMMFPKPIFVRYSFYVEAGLLVIRRVLPRQADCCDCHVSLKASSQ
jgi:hypothetical protein